MRNDPLETLIEAQDAPMQSKGVEISARGAILASHGLPHMWMNVDRAVSESSRAAESVRTRPQCLKDGQGVWTGNGRRPLPTAGVHIIALSAGTDRLAGRCTSWRCPRHRALWCAADALRWWVTPVTCSFAFVLFFLHKAAHADHFVHSRQAIRSNSRARIGDGSP